MHFGKQYLASHFVRNNTEHPLSNLKVPLSVVLCRSCGLLQLQETVDRQVLFRDYFYRSGTNPMMYAALKDVVEDISKKIDLKQGDCILDIGCNDCTMLSLFSNEYNRIGIEPSTNINWDGVDPSIHIVNNFFSQRDVLRITNGSLCRVVTSIAMFYSVEDVNAFTSEVKSILAPDGVWCIQLSYLPATIKSMSFYDICHEHLYYFSLTVLDEFMESNGLSIYDVSTNDVNGGSLRVFVSHKELDKSKPEHFYKLLEEERNMCLFDQETYQSFFRKIGEMKQKVISYIRHEAESGNLVIGLGASTKGNVLLQFFGIDNHSLPYISERNPEKVSLRTLGTDIELISEEQARALKPSCMVVLIWPFKEEIIRRESLYLQNGGKLLFPMPYCHIVTKDGEMRL
jgi:hypothetical protein